MKDETLKIGDLGISRNIIDSMQVMSTNIGAPYYQAPEMLI